MFAKSDNYLMHSSVRRRGTVLRQARRRQMQRAAGGFVVALIIIAAALSGSNEGHAGLRTNDDVAPAHAAALFEATGAGALPGPGLKGPSAGGVSNSFAATSDSTLIDNRAAARCTRYPRQTPQQSALVMVHSP